MKQDLERKRQAKIATYDGRLPRPVWVPDGQKSGEARAIVDDDSIFAEALASGKLFRDVDKVVGAFDWHSQVTVHFAGYSLAGGGFLIVMLVSHFIASPGGPAQKAANLTYNFKLDVSVDGLSCPQF